MGQPSFHEGFARVERLAPGSSRTFGLVFFFIFALIALLPLLNSRDIRPWALVASLIFLAISAFKPSFLAPLNVLWFRFGLLLHRVTNPVILVGLFLIVFTPVAVIARLFRHQFLALSTDKSCETYWTTRKSDGRASPMNDQF